MRGDGQEGGKHREGNLDSGFDLWGLYIHMKHAWPDSDVSLCVCLTWGKCSANIAKEVLLSSSNFKKKIIWTYF